MKQVLVFDGWQPTALNKLLRMERHARSATILDEAQIVGAEAFRQGLVKAKGRRRLALEILYAGRKGDVDPDALHKVLLDSLKASGHLLNDDRQSLQLPGVTHTPAKKHGLIVTLEDLEPLT